MRPNSPPSAPTSRLYAVTGDQYAYPTVSAVLHVLTVAPTARASRRGSRPVVVGVTGTAPPARH